MGSKRNSYLKSKHGMNTAGFNKLLEKHGGKCAICFREPTKRQLGGVLYVDHNHSTGEIRGLLCGNCNAGLGMFGDNINSLKNAVHYLGCYGGRYDDGLELLERLNIEVSDCADFVNCGEFKVADEEYDGLILSEIYDARFAQREEGFTRYDRFLQ